MLLLFLRWQKSFVYDILQYIVTGLFLYERSMDMSGKRRDSKNRILRNGESQRQDGRYAFKYIDANIIKKEAFGKKRIDKVKLSDAKCWLIKLQQDGRGYSSIHSVRGVVRPAFQMAVDDDLIRKNPFEFQLATVVVNDSVTREAITRKQERAFLEFVAQDKHFCRYYDGIYILFKTGLRISEFVGLTLNDIDMQNRKINVNH